VFKNKSPTAATCLQGIQPSVSKGAVVELLLLLAASAAMVGMKIVSFGTDSGANKVQLADNLKIFKTDHFDSDTYLQSKCCAMDEKEVRHLCSYLQDLKKAFVEEMCRSVHANYVVFIKTSKDILDLEGELLSVRNLPSTQSALIHGLFEGVQIDSLATGPEGSTEQDISGAKD
jgi:exocyst complex component 8